MNNKTLRKVQNYIYNIRDLYRNDVKPSLRKKYFDVLTTLYEERKIENKRTLQKAIDQLKRGNKKLAKETINKYKDALTVQGIIKGTPDRDIFVSAIIHRIVKYKSKSGDIREYSSKDEKHKNIFQKQDLVYAEKVKAKSEKQAQQIVTKDIHEDFEDDFYGHDAEIKDIEFTSTLDIKDLTKTSHPSFYKKEAMFLKSSSHVNYNFTHEENKYLENKGTCVIDNLVGKYSDKIKKLNKENLLKILDKFYNKKSALDEGLEDNSTKWSIEDGVSSLGIQHICEHFDISMYAYDILNNCFLKYISKNRHYDCLAYYAIDSHMYLVKNEHVKSLVEKAKERNLSSVAQTEVIKEKSIFDGQIINENIDVKNITGFKADVNIFIYSRKSHNAINDILEEFITYYNEIPSNIKSNKSQIQQFECEINKCKYIIANDPNDLSTGINYKSIQELCSKHNIEFSNQTYVRFCQQLKDQFETPVRKERTQQEKLDIVKLFKNKCALCNESLKKGSYEIDHKIPLFNNGLDEVENLQPLCKSCHKEKSNEEQASGFNKIDKACSSYNQKVGKIMKQSCKAYAFREKLIDDKLIKDKKLFTIDMNKSYTNCLYHNKYEFPVFTEFDQVKKYKPTNNKTAGIYYVKTESYNPLRGSDWYPLNIVEYCLEQNIITEDDIKFVILSDKNLNLPCDYYNKWIDYIKQTLDTSKLCINSMVGMFAYNADKRENWSSKCITRDSYEAMNAFIENDSHFIDVMTINDQKYYHVFKMYESIQIETKKNIYNHVIHQQNINLHKLAKLIESKGGQIVDLISDAITCTFPNDELPFELENDGLNIKGYYYSDKTNKYKIESPHRLKCEAMRQYKTDAEEPIIQKPKYTIFKDVSDNNFQPLVNQMIDLNQSFLVTGSAGVGKSHFTRMIQDELTKRDLKFISLAPTNLAANIINGITLNRFRIKVKTTKKIDSLRLDYIIVDEVSMMKSEFYTFIKMIKAYKKDIKIVFIGDYNQLDPVNDRITCDYGNSLILHELVDRNKLTLTTCRRSDNTLFNMLQYENIMELKRSDFSRGESDKNISYTNNKRMEINAKYMDKYKTKDSIKLNKITHDPNSQDVYIYKNLPIMSTKTNEKMNLIKNKQYQIIEIDNEIIIIGDKECIRKYDEAKQQATKSHKKFIISDECIIIKINDFQKFFYPSYCITCHKSQGQTIDESYTIHEFNKMNHKLRYVALSRATKLEYINII